MTESSARRVLVIDDMGSMRAMTKHLLTSLGCEITGEAENGADGFTRFQVERPDLVLLDIEMPVQDGITTLKMILADDAEANVIMLTSVDSMMVVEDCLFAGAKDFIRKDLPPEALKARLGEELAKLG